MSSSYNSTSNCDWATNKINFLPFQRCFVKEENYDLPRYSIDSKWTKLITI